MIFNFGSQIKFIVVDEDISMDGSEISIPNNNFNGNIVINSQFYQTSDNEN